MQNKQNNRKSNNLGFLEFGWNKYIPRNKKLRQILAECLCHLAAADVRNALKLFHFLNIYIWQRSIYQLIIHYLYQVNFFKSNLKSEIDVDRVAGGDVVADGLHDQLHQVRILLDQHRNEQVTLKVRWSKNLSDLENNSRASVPLLWKWLIMLNRGKNED